MQLSDVEGVGVEESGECERVIAISAVVAVEECCHMDILVATAEGLPGATQRRRDRVYA